MTLALQQQEIFDTLLQTECNRCIGGTMFIFYTPISVGDFTLSCWLKQNVNSSQYLRQQSNRDYGLSLHENGEIIDPTCDSRFLLFEWAVQKKSAEQWLNCSFHRREILQIICDVMSLV
eukprot:TRINITY_DN11101_c0_g1_i1.p1 TRINITY_DN11101_c0_g1~~TRINITY_DN11101_c0_g1_i1.p1  ORF type:complete len:119 (-),score=13.34 TRINITY_DN11101_c0_g1_i1:9-365(-)